MHVLLLAVLITVTGQGNASAQPDMATETFTIATSAADAAQAASENNRRYSATEKRLRALGISQSDIRTTGYNINYAPPPQPEPAQGAPGGVIRPLPQPTGYFVTRTIEVTLHDLNAVGKAVDAAVESGVTDIGSVAYGVRDVRALQQHALAAAVADARAQAQTMAAAAGLQRLRIRSMQQGYAAAPPPAPYMRGAVMQAANVLPPTQLQPNAVEVSAQVTVVFEAS